LYSSIEKTRQFILPGYKENPSSFTGSAPLNRL